jgi:Family of unknown function (DUF6194)
MTETEIVEFVTGALTGVDVVVASEATGAPEVAWGDTFFFYDPDGDGSGDHRFPFATIVIKDYPDVDTQSNLDRPGVFRLNVGVGKETFRRLFPDFPDHDTQGDDRYDFAALDTPLPHPIYGAQSWVSIVNPGDRTSDLARSLLAEAHQRAVARHERRTAR